MQYTNVLISVIVPIYNVEKYLPKCIESICNQTHQNLEIILVDDGATDGSGAICDSYKEKDERIKVIHKKNGGLSDARNAGLQICTGEFIGFVDSDDYIAPDMYEVLLRASIKENAEVSMCGRYKYYEETGTVEPLFILEQETVMHPEEAIKRLLLWDGCDSAAWDKLYKRELFQKRRYPIGVICEDLNVTTRIFSECTKIVHIGMGKYYYLMRGNSISRGTFSTKKFDAYEQSKLNMDFVRTNFPKLQKEAEYFCLRNSLGIVFSAVTSSVEKAEDRKRVLKVIQKNIKPLLLNKYVKWEEKVFNLKLILKFLIK